LLLVQGLFSLADALMGFVADKSGDSDTVVTTTEAPTITRSDVEAVLSAVHIRASVELAGWPDTTADLLLARGVTAATADQMLCDALRRIQ
jgi:hypothetical protein